MFIGKACVIEICLLGPKGQRSNIFQRGVLSSIVCFEDLHAYMRL